MVDLYSTRVPNEFQGHGLGRVLATAAFEHVEKNDLRMRLTCWYLKKIVDEQEPFKKFAKFVVS